MKYLPSALGVFLLLLAQSLFAAQPSFEDVKPFLTDKTYCVYAGELSAVNYEEIVSEVKTGAKTLFPRVMAEPSVQAYIEKIEQWGKECSEWRKEAMTISDGYEYMIVGLDGICEIIPVKNPDPAVEKDFMKIWDNLENHQNQITKTFLSLRTGAKADPDETHSQHTIIRTENAIVCFTPLTDSESLDDEEEIFPSNLEGYLKGVSQRPDFAVGFEKAKTGKTSTILLALPQVIREAIQNNLDDLESPEDFPLTQEEISELVNSTQCAALTLDSIFGFNSIQVIFDSEESAKNALSAFDEFYSFLKENILGRRGFSLGTGELLVMEYIYSLNPIQTPTQNGSILTLGIDKNSDPTKILMDDLAQFQASQREKYRVDAKAEADRQYETLKPWITEGTFLVGRVDLDRVTPTQWFEAVNGSAGKLFPITMNLTPAQKGLDQLTQPVQTVESFLSGLKAKGAKEAYVVADASNMMVPVRIFLPGVTLKQDADPEKGAVLSAEDIFGDSETLKELRPLIDRGLVFGQMKDAVVIFPRVNEDTPSDACWESFISTLKPTENPSFRNGLELNAQCGFSFVLNMNPMLAEFVKQGINGVNEDEKILSVPSTQFIVDGLNIVALGLDPNLGLFEFNVLSKSPKAAKKAQKLLSLWKQEILSKIEKALDPDLESPVLEALLLDFFDFYISLAMPVRDGNRLYWNINQDERVKFLNEKFSSPTQTVIVTGTFAVMLLPAVHSVFQITHKTKISNNYKEIAIAMLNYDYTFQSFPTAYTVNEVGDPMHSWRVMILPFLGEQDLYEQIRLDEPWDSEWNSQFHDRCPKVYQSVSHPDPSEAVIGVVVGEKTVFPPVKEKGQKGTTTKEIQDGLSNTILLVPCEPVCWMDPRRDPRMEYLQSPDDVFYYGGRGTFPTAFCDGSVHHLFFTVAPETWLALLTRNGQERIRDSDWDSEYSETSRLPSRY